MPAWNSWKRRKILIVSIKECTIRQSGTCCIYQSGRDQISHMQWVMWQNFVQNRTSNTGLPSNICGTWKVHWILVYFTAKKAQGTALGIWMLIGLETLNDRKSTSGYVPDQWSSCVSWRSMKQSVAMSEAEYMALASAAQKAIWMWQLTTDLRNAPTGATVILEDNQSAICMAKNPQFHGRAKHIGIKYHFIREQVNSGTVELKCCPTEEK